MYQFSGFPQKKVQVPTLYSDTFYPVLTPYLQYLPQEVPRSLESFSEQPSKGTLIVPALFEPAFTPSREAHWILRKGNSEESSASKKSNFYCPRFARKNALFQLKSPETETLAEEVTGVLTLELNTTQQLLLLTLVEEVTGVLPLGCSSQGELAVKRLLKFTHPPNTNTNFNNFFSTQINSNLMGFWGFGVSAII